MTIRSIGFHIRPLIDLFGGFGLAQEFTSLGFNITLHSRSASKVDAKRQDLIFEYLNVKVELVAADASLNAVENAHKVAQVVSSKRVTVFVNNLAKGGVT